MFVKHDMEWIVLLGSYKVQATKFHDISMTFSIFHNTCYHMGLDSRKPVVRFCEAYVIGFLEGIISKLDTGETSIF